MRSSLLLIVLTAATFTVCDGNLPESPSEYLMSAMHELNVGVGSISSKRDFISSDDRLDAGVVHEGPEEVRQSAINTAADNVQEHVFGHSRHSQIGRDQNRSPVYIHSQQKQHQSVDNNNQQQQTYRAQQPQYHSPEPQTPLPSPSYLSSGHSPPDDYFPVDTQKHKPDEHIESVPPLTKEELAALYDAAVHKGSQLDLANLPGGVEALGDPNVGSMPGYYYYYYPIKNIPKKEEGEGDGQKEGGDGNGAMDNGGGPQMVEPLFVAVAAFMGVSIIFMFSLLFLPKLGFFHTDGIGLASKVKSDDLSGLTRVVLESVDGKDCDQRIACELGKVLKKLKMHDRPLRVLEAMLSKQAKKHIQDVRRAANYRTNCHLIRCRRKSRDLS